MRSLEAFLLSLGLLLLPACGTVEEPCRPPQPPPHEINYLAVSCEPHPRVNVIIRPDPVVPLCREAAWFAYQVRENVSDRESFERYAGFVFRAFLKERVFQGLAWRGRLTATLERQARERGVLLVVLEGLRVVPATKAAPGLVALAVRVLDPAEGFSLWELTGEMELCPCYPEDWVVTVTRGEPPSGTMDAAQRAFFLLARVVARAMRPT